MRNLAVLLATLATAVSGTVVNFDDLSSTCGSLITLPSPYQGLLITDAKYVNVTTDVGCHAHSGGGGPWGKCSSSPICLSADTNSITFALATAGTFDIQGFHLTTELPGVVYRRANTSASLVMVASTSDGVSERSSTVVPPKGRVYSTTITLDLVEVSDVTVAFTWDYVDMNGVQFFDQPVGEAYVDDIEIEF